MVKERISAMKTVRVGLYNLFNIREFLFSGEAQEACARVGDGDGGAGGDGGGNISRWTCGKFRRVF